MKNSGPAKKRNIINGRGSAKTRNTLIYIGLAGVTLGLILTFGTTLSHPLERAISLLENRYQEWFAGQETANPVLLLPLAFMGGVLASVSPCILALLPVNLSYIGTLTITSRRDALVKSGLFVLGSVTVLSLFGLVSAFAGAVMVEYRGYINLSVGVIMVMMGLCLLGILKLPSLSLSALGHWLVGIVRWPPVKLSLPDLGPYGVGLTFAMVSSPCASPVLFAVLAGAGATGSAVLGILTMVSYALGYTSLIFLASLFTGLAKGSRKLLPYGNGMMRFGSAALIMTGIYYLFTGTRWFLGL